MVRQVEDNKTVDLVGGLPKRRGRKPKYATPAEKQAAYRERHQLRQLNVQIAADVFDALSAYVDRQFKDGAGLNQSQVVEKLLRTQLLRKR